MSENGTDTATEPHGIWRPLTAYERFADRVSEVTGTISMWVVLPTIAVGFINTILRYVGQATGTKLTNNTIIELQWYLYSLIFLLGFGYILKHQINVRVDFWFANQSQRTRAWIDFWGHLIGLLPFCLIGLWVSIPQALASWRVWELSPDADGLPRAPIKMMIVVAFVLLFMQANAEMVRITAILRGHPDYVELPETPDAPIRVE